MPSHKWEPAPGEVDQRHWRKHKLWEWVNAFKIDCSLVLSTFYVLPYYNRNYITHDSFVRWMFFSLHVGYPPRKFFYYWSSEMWDDDVYEEAHRA